MAFKKICDQLNISKQCKRYDLSLMECPHFLTVLFGLVTIIAMVSAYVVGNKYTNQPELVALIVIGITTFLMVIGYLIIKSFTTLAEASQMKSEFVSIASHQLRTPLSIIKWTLNAISDINYEKLSSEQQSYLKDMGESNQRMINLVNDLLNVSRIDQKRLKLQPEEMDLKKVTEELIKEYEVITKTNNVTVAINFGNGPSLVWADPQKIKLVIQNLFDNAIRYSANHKEKTITILIKKTNSSIRWEIQDQGIGIPKDDQDKIFEKFFRSQNTLRYQTQGTGLGLFIAKAFIEQSGGKIGFKSKEDHGSTFWFELPTNKPKA